MDYSSFLSPRVVGMTWAAAWYVQYVVWLALSDVLRSSFEAINFARIAQAQAHLRKMFFRNDNSALSLHNLNCNRELH